MDEAGWANGIVQRDTRHGQILTLASELRHNRDDVVDRSYGVTVFVHVVADPDYNGGYALVLGDES